MPAGEGTADRLPTNADLQLMSDVELLNTLVDLSRRLHERLASLTTGEGWQRHLKLPEAALPPPSPSGHVSLGIKALTATLERYDRVAANPQYEMIAGLPNFSAMHVALGQAVGRFGSESAIEGPALGAPTQTIRQNVPRQEALPAPEPDLETESDEASSGTERSVLKRTTRS